MTTEEHQILILKYMVTIPEDSTRYAICKQLVKDLEAKRHCVDPPFIHTRNARRVKHKEIEFKSIGQAADFMGLTRNQLYNDLINDRKKYDAFLI